VPVPVPVSVPVPASVSVPVPVSAPAPFVKQSLARHLRVLPGGGARRPSAQPKGRQQHRKKQETAPERDEQHEQPRVAALRGHAAS